MGDDRQSLLGVISQQGLEGGGEAQAGLIGRLEAEDTLRGLGKHLLHSGVELVFGGKKADIAAVVFVQPGSDEGGELQVGGSQPGGLNGLGFHAGNQQGWGMGGELLRQRLA